MFKIKNASLRIVYRSKSHVRFVALDFQVSGLLLLVFVVVMDFFVVVMDFLLLKAWYPGENLQWLEFLCFRASNSYKHLTFDLVFILVLVGTNFLTEISAHEPAKLYKFWDFQNMFILVAKFKIFFFLALEEVLQGIDSGVDLFDATYTA